MTVKEKTVELGLSESYFRAIKKICPDNYKLFDLLGNGDLCKGYLDATEDLNNMKIRVCDIFIGANRVEKKFIVDTVMDVYKPKHRVEVYRILNKYYLQDTRFYYRTYINLKEILKRIDNEKSI